MLSFSQFNEHIEKVGNKFRLVSRSANKNLGTYSTKAGAEKREKQVQWFKSHNEGANSFNSANYNDGDEGVIGSIFRRMSIDTPLQPTVEDLGKDPGMYSYFGLTDESAEALYKWSKQVGIPNPVTPEKLHSTCIFSPVSFQNYTIQEEPFVANPDDYSLGILGPDEQSSALVLKYKSQVAESQWEKARKLGAKSDFPSYIPHITLSYDPQGFDYSKIKPFDKPIKFQREYVQTLDKEGYSHTYNKKFEELNWDNVLDKAKETVHNWVKKGEGRAQMSYLAKLTKKPEFKKFHPGNVTVYRGENEDSKDNKEVGASFSKSKNIADKYAGEDGNVVSKQVTSSVPALDVNKLLDLKSKLKDKEVFVAKTEN